MKKFACLSDIHLLWKNPRSRLDDLTVTQFEKLDFISNWCQHNNATLLQAGDFGDVPRSFYLTVELYKFLKLAKGFNICCVYGQHDTYLYSEMTREYTMLGLLGLTQSIYLLGEKPYYTIDVENVSMYGVSYGQDIPNVIDKNDTNVLVIHAPIAKRAFYPNQKYMDAEKFLTENKDFDLIICGDIHNENFCITKDGRTILNTGPLLRKTADEYSFTQDVGFYSYDIENKEIEWIKVPHQPANKVLSREKLDEASRREDVVDEFIEEVLSADDIDGDEFIEVLNNLIKKKKANKEVIGILSEIMGKERMLLK